MNTKFIPGTSVNKFLILLNLVIAVVYFSWWLDFRHVGNPLLYFLLIFGEIYHILMTCLFLLTIWPNKKYGQDVHQLTNMPSIDVFIPVVNEPIEVVRKTALAAKNMLGFSHKVYILNDGFLAKNPNWQDMELLTKTLGINCITRRNGKGAKAGNINNALKQTNGDIVVIFDADMVAHPDFLAKTIPYFTNERVGFVQTPQYYNNKDINLVTKSSWEQQEFFFGAIMKGKEGSNAAFICGTNVAIRRIALLEAGGMYENSIAEDFLTSLFIHQNGWKSYYTQEVLAEGLAPQDMQAYCKQQLRWARGSLEVLFNQNLMFKQGLSISQKLQYLSSALYYFNGLIVLIDMIVPLVFLYTGIQTVVAATTSFAFFFIPFMTLNLYSLYLSSEKTLTFRAIAFSYALWSVQLLAIFSALTGQKVSFSVTPKNMRGGVFLSFAIPHLIYILAALTGIIYRVQQDGFNPSVATNVAWTIFNVVMFLPFILTSIQKINIPSVSAKPSAM